MVSVIVIVGSGSDISENRSLGQLCKFGREQCSANVAAISAVLKIKSTQNPDRLLL